MAGRPPLGPARLSERLVVHVTAAEAARIEAAAAAAGVHRAEWIRRVLAYAPANYHMGLRDVSTCIVADGGVVGYPAETDS